MTVAIGDNMPKIRERLAFTMAIYPWVQMVMFSELSVFGPDTRLAQQLPGPVEVELCALARHYGIWLLPGSPNLAELQKLGPLAKPTRGSMIGINPKAD